MLTHISTTTTNPPPIKFIYSVKHPLSTEKILFHDRLQEIISKHPGRITLDLFITGQQDGASSGANKQNAETGLDKSHKGRITPSFLLNALGSTDKKALQKTPCFVCGPPKMTDEIVAFLEKQGARVYCEKWW